MAALIGALRVSLSADTAAFQQGMKRAERQAKTSASSIQKSLGLVKAGFAGFLTGFSLSTVFQATKASLEYAGSLGEIAQQLGVTTRELQVFRYAAGQNGASIEEADKALGKFSVSVSKALSGSKQAAAAFNAVGVSLDDLRKKSKTELIGQIADRMKETGGASANAAAGVALFSRGFQKLIPLLDQGSKGFSELEAAAEQLGIILDDKLINQADEAADKVDALQTVLKAQIAGAVAQNSAAIVELANSLVYLVSKIADAIRWWSDFKNALDAQAFDLASRNPFLSPAKRKEGAERAAMARGKISDNGVGWGVAGSSVTVTLDPVKRKVPTTGSPSRFLGGGGGGGRSRRAPRDTSLRDAFQFEEEQRRAEMDILRAKQDLAHDYVERTALSIQMLDLEKKGFEAQLQYEVASGEKTKAQAETLRLKNEESDRLRRMAVLEEEEEQRQRDYNALEEKDFENKMRLLEGQAQLAETASERRDVELRILDLAYEEERRRLNRIIAESKDWAEIEAARRDLLNLSANQSVDRQNVNQRTRGPMEDWLASLPTTAAKAQEAFEQLQVQGFEGLIDSALALTEGFGSAKDALLDTLKQFLLGLLKMQLQQGFASILSGGFKLPGFALGGDTLGTSRHRIAGVVHGEEGILNPRGMSTLGVPNLNALNRGAPLTTLISNDNQRGSVRDVSVNVYGVTDVGGFNRSQSQIARQTKRALGITD